MDKDTSVQPPCFDEVYRAVHDSISHWKRICAYIKAELYDGRYDDTDGLDVHDMLDEWRWEYGEAMHGHSCPLCKLYECYCPACVLKEKWGYDCNDDRSLWWRTINSESLSDMLENANIMVKFLEGLKHELVEERQ